MDPKLLQQIEDYLRASGLRADELKKRMDDVKASTAEFNRELLNAQRHTAELNRDFNDLSSQFKNIVDDLRKWDSTSSKINKSYKTLGGLADKLKYDSEDISRLSKKDLESLDKKARIELSNLKARKAELDHAAFSSHNVLLNNSVNYFRNWHYTWSSYYIRIKYRQYISAILYLLRIGFINFLKTLFYFIFFKKKYFTSKAKL